MTVGYEGTNIERFVETLVEQNVQVLVDVRELPLSRKRGFSKSRLCEAVNAAGIDYVHLKALGDPKPGRMAARAGDFETFREVFGQHMMSESAQSALEQLSEMISNRLACLLCFERCHKGCHRSIIADHLEQNYGASADHIAIE